MDALHLPTVGRAPDKHRDQLQILGRLLTVMWSDDQPVTDEQGRPLLPSIPRPAPRRRFRKPW